MLGEAQAALAENLKNPLKQYLVGKKKEIPPHLKSVPLQKQYITSDMAMFMSTFRLAMKKELIYDGGYDAGVQPPYPMILVIDK